jgi:hypothetical protein
MLTWRYGRAQVVAACSPTRLSTPHGSRWYQLGREMPPKPIDNRGMTRRSRRERKRLRVQWWQGATRGNNKTEDT